MPKTLKRAKTTKSVQRPDYWMVKITFPNMAPFESRYDSIREMAERFEVAEPTLRKIVYDKNYKSKLFKVFNTFAEIKRCYV